MTDFDKKIAILRKEIGLSQRELAIILKTTFYNYPEMLERFKAFKMMTKKIYFTHDALVHEISNSKRYSHK